MPKLVGEEGEELDSNEPYSYPEIFEIFAINNLSKRFDFDNRVFKLKGKYLEKYKPVVRKVIMARE